VREQKDAIKESRHATGATTCFAQLQTHEIRNSARRENMVLQSKHNKEVGGGRVSERASGGARKSTALYVQKAKSQRVFLAHVR
jgi:hypothetical protein